ncbi:conserved Plasmodium protein, unknown function [Plasmodium ovale wallikeri]|uniref:Uncharacterized protein n=1 Tax=Plasmodium ovale wallikeri TaxID=864142 RepID=A0A1A8YTN4_PLAOA|nr:conserved Plasmodium protein, unknown function [Plasmodium ovale wallikeri]SBT35299.1 conserved Plasmodium protein, unknown function [Plasmodium ovale wallikeri]
MVITQAFLLLLALIDIKCIICIKIENYKKNLSLQLKNCLHKNDEIRRKKETPLFVNINYAKKLNIGNTFIIEKWKRKCQLFSLAKRQKGEKEENKNVIFSPKRFQQSSANVISHDSDENIVKKKNDNTISDCKEIINVYRGGEVETNRGSTNGKVESAPGKTQRGTGTNETHIKEKGVKEKENTHVTNKRIYYNKIRVPLNVVDLQNTNVRSSLLSQREERWEQRLSRVRAPLTLLNHIYRSWKEKKFSNFLGALSDKDFDYTCMEQWLHKFSISLNKNHFKIKLKDDHVLIRNKFPSDDKETLREFKIEYNTINECLKMLIKDIEKFCSYEITSILWAVTIILLKCYKSSNNSGSILSTLHSTDMITSIVKNFKIFFSLTVKNLNNIKYNLSIDESLWAIWSICKLLYFNISFDAWLSGETVPRDEAFGSVSGDVSGDVSDYVIGDVSDYVIGDVSDYVSGDVSGATRRGNDGRSDLCTVREEAHICRMSDEEMKINTDKVKKKIPEYTDLQVQFLMKKFKLSCSGCSGCSGSSGGLNNLSKYNKDIFRIKTLSKIYKLIKCISKIFYPLKNKNIMNIILHNNYNILDINIIGKFIEICNDTLVKYVDYFVFIINYINSVAVNRGVYKKKGIPSKVNSMENCSKGRGGGGESLLVEINENVKRQYKNELIFIYNCLKNSLVSMIKLDLKNKFIYDWLNKNIHLFQFVRVAGGGSLPNTKEEAEIENESHIENERVVAGRENGEVKIHGEGGLQSGGIVLGRNATGDYGYEVNGFHDRDDTSHANIVLGEKGEKKETGQSQSSSDVCLDVLALSRFNKLYNSDMKRKLIENVERSIENSVKKIEAVYAKGGSSVDGIREEGESGEEQKLPSYVVINDIYIIREKRIEEMYNQETKTFYKKNKNVEFLNVIMPKQLSIFINYIGRNTTLVAKEKLNKIILLSVKYINITKFNYFTSNDIIHFLQGLLNYVGSRINSELWHEPISKMLSLLCSTVQHSFLKWKSSNICQLIYLLAKFKHIHRYIFNQFDEYLSFIKFPLYVYEKANLFDDIRERTYSNQGMEQVSPMVENSESINNNTDNGEATNRANIYINDVKYDNLGSAMWAMTSLSKNVIKKKNYLKFFYLFSVYFSLHMKLFLCRERYNGRGANGSIDRDWIFLRDNAHLFKMPLDTMTELSYMLYSLAHINKNALRETIFHENEIISQGKNREISEFATLGFDLCIEDIDNLYDVDRHKQVEQNRGEVTIDGTRISGNIESGGHNHMYNKRENRISLKENVLQFKYERVNLSSEFLNLLMQKLISYMSYILEKGTILEEITQSNNTPYMSNLSKRNKVEVIDIMKLIYSFFILLNQNIQKNKKEEINIDILEIIIHKYNLVIKKILNSISYIYFIIDTYSLISNICTLDTSTKGMIKVSLVLVVVTRVVHLYPSTSGAEEVRA